MANEKILDTVKTSIPMAITDTSYDADLMLYINGTLGILSQLGFKEADKLSFITIDTTWLELIGDRTDCEIVKTFICFKVKLMFDPPTSSAALEALNRLVAEQEWRIVNLDINKGM